MVDNVGCGHPDGMPIIFGGPVHFDGTTILFFLLAMLAAAVIAGVVPALIVATLAAALASNARERRVFWWAFAITLVLWLPTLTLIVLAQ